MTPRRLSAVPDAPHRAIGLIRVSRERDGMLSPDLQRAAIEEHAARAGIHVIEWMEGLDESGSRSKSSWWARLDAAVAKVEAGDVDTILVWKWSRLARHRLKWAVALDRVEAAGGRVESATEPIDTSTSAGRFARGMLAEFAAFEAERTGETWKETHRSRRARGLPHGGWRSGLGYRKARGTWVPDPDTCDLVVEAYRRYVAGDGWQTVANWLAARGVISHTTGRPFTSRGICSVMDSGFAAGLLHVDGDYMPAAHEPIVDKRLWSAYRRARGKRSVTPPRLVSPASALSGLLICDACDHRMQVKSDVRHGPHYVYSCKFRECRSKAHVTRTRAEAAVRARLAEFAGDVEGYARLAEVAGPARAVAKAEVARLTREVHRLDVALGRLLARQAQERLPVAAFEHAQDELVTERDRAQAELEKLQAVADRPRPSVRVVRGLLADWDRIDTATSRRLVGTLVGEVRVSRVPGKRCSVAVRMAWE